MIKRLAHLCFRTNRFREMTEFYRDTLSLQQKFELRLPDGTIFGRYFCLGDTSFLELFDHEGATKMWGSSGPITPPDGRWGYQHFCLQTERLAELCDALRAKGWPVTAITMGMDNSRQAWIKDPDGNDIELMEYTETSLQLANSND